MRPLFGALRAKFPRPFRIFDLKGFRVFCLFCPSFSAHIAQSVEHVLGKDEVTGSIPVVGSTGSGNLRARNAR